MTPLSALPLPMPLAVVAWCVAGLGLAWTAVVAWRRLPITLGAWCWALVPALLGQLGTLSAAGAGVDALGGADDPRTAAAASFAHAVGAEAHGYLAGGLVALALAARGFERRPQIGAAIAGGCGLVGATAVALLVGAPSAWLFALAIVGGLAVAAASTRSGPAVAGAATLGVALFWLGARHALLFAEHAPVVSGALPLVAELVRARGQALDAVMVAGPGLLVSTGLAAWLAGVDRTALHPRGLLAAAVGLACVVGLGAVNTSALGPLRDAAAGGSLGSDGNAGLPRIEGGSVVPRASCVATPGSAGWALRSRFEARGCADEDRLLVAAPGEAPAHFVGGETWFAEGDPRPSGTLELMTAVPPSGERRGPLLALGVAAVPVQWVAEALPEAFTPDRQLADQLEGWLDAQLGVPRAPDHVPGSVWMVDTPQGAMILMTGGGITVEDPEHRREIVGRLLASGDAPRVVLVLGARWTVQQALDLCDHGRREDGETVPCVWVRRR